MIRYDDDYDPERDGPSKTQLKQAGQDVRDLGVALLALSASQLDAIGLNPVLREALREHGRMPTREAKRRHLQFVAKLMRDTGAETLARRALDAIRAGEARVLAQAEAWRARLLADDAALTDWVKAHPAAEVQPLRTLIRNARREIAALLERQPPAPAGQSRAYRDLFQALRVQVQRAAASARDAAVPEQPDPQPD